MSDLPEEIERALQAFDDSVSNIQSTLQPLLKANYSELLTKLDAPQRARFDLLLAYTVSSLFWMYLTASGVAPQSHPVKQELERIKEYMGKLKKAIEEKELKKNFQINVPATQRMLRNALWAPSSTENL
ncbi:hypothetical protein Zmor_028540, partial [Zophobas morio]